VEERVRTVLAAFGVEAQAAPPLATWIGLVERWNKKVDLTAARSPEELVDLMLADAALLAGKIDRSARVVDVGTGAGAPGLALGLLRPDLDLTLVEPLQKRVAFVRTVLGSIAVTSVRIERARGDELVRAGRSFDVAISRATLPPPEWLALGALLGREVWLLLARDEPPARPGLIIAEDVRYRWPLTGAERRAVRYVPSGA
jgi:16S rRNA (guanine527-N7)-methyltransferase